MQEANKDIRAEIDDAGLKYWQVAGKIGVHPTTFTVWLRTPLDDAKQDKVREAIKQLETQVNTA